MFDIVAEVFKWPFGMLYSCYWAGMINYLPLAESQFPSLLYIEDGWLGKMIRGELSDDWIRLGGYWRTLSFVE